MKMIKKFRKHLKVVSIDILVYHMRTQDLTVFPNPGFAVESGIAGETKKEYFIKDDGSYIHKSFVFNKLHVLKLIGKTGPAIGDCVTVPAYKGRSIYPFVINHLAGEMLRKKESEEVFIIVNSNNASSIRGIEKAGFKLFKKIKAKRFLLFYFDVKIE